MTEDEKNAALVLFQNAIATGEPTLFVVNGSDLSIAYLYSDKRLNTVIVNSHDVRISDSRVVYGTRRFDAVVDTPRRRPSFLNFVKRAFLVTGRRA